MTSQIFAMLAAAGIVTAGVAGAGATRSETAIPLAMLAQGASGGECIVNVARTGQGGTFDVARQVLADGSCVCNVTTGPSGSNGAAEGQVTGILESRSCAGAAAAAGEGAAGAGAGGGGSLLPVLLGVVGAGGAAAGLGGSSNG